MPCAAFSKTSNKDFILIRLKTIVLPILFLLISSGCAQTSINNPFSGKTGKTSGQPAAQKTPEDSDYTVIVEGDLPPEEEAGSPKKSDDAVPEKILSEDNQNSAVISKQAVPKERLGKKVQPVLDEALDFCQVSQDFWQKGELENALEALDQAYSLILNVDTSNRPKLIQQKEDLRFMISKRILEIYASRNIVVNGHHNAIPIDINPHIQAEINSLSAKSRELNFFTRSYKRSGRYRPFILKELKAAGIPEELSWLPLIESGFKVNALSRARALGLWQFISSTGYKFGLKRTTYVDERLDPVKATRAAIAYLKELHQIFGDWTTVLAAYNCGEGRVLRVIRSQNVNYLDNFWDLYTRLPRETARYVPRFLATLHILKNPAKYGIDKIQPDAPVPFETITVNKKARLRDIAKVIGISEKALKNLNPELRHNVIPGDDYPLRVPPQMGAVLAASIDKVPSYKRAPSSFGYYKVRPGDTLSTIARRHRTSVSSIMRANNLRKSNYIVAGKRLKIPQRGAGAKPAIQTRKKVDLKAAVHVVKRGDNLWIIARRYGTTTQKIQAVNGLNSTHLHIGQRLKIPGRKSDPLPSDGYKTYLVRRGDSPFRIAQNHKMALEKLLRINRLTPRSRIYPGQALNVE